MAQTKKNLFVSIVSISASVQQAGLLLMNELLEHPIDQAIGELTVAHYDIARVIRMLENLKG